jgi:hypothetical protein
MLQETVLKDDPVRYLNREELGNLARPSLRPTRTTFLNILVILGGDDILTRLGMIHDRFLVWEEAVESPIEDTSGNKGINVADGKAIRIESLAQIKPNCTQQQPATSHPRPCCLMGERRRRDLQMLTA